MIVVDANVFLRYIVRPASPADQRMATTAATLLRRVDDGDETITTSDAVIAEVVFILASPRHYHLPRTDIAALLKPILQLSGVRMPDKQRHPQALDLWVMSPKLSYVDALVAVMARELGGPVASFDRGLLEAAGLPAWRPDVGGAQTPRPRSSRSP